MKPIHIFYLIIIAGIIGITGCGGKDKELKADATDIANIMCRSIDAMKKLRGADPADSLMVKKLQVEYNIIQEEMTKVYQDFRTKYKEKVTTKEFSDQFRKYLNTAMLDCKSLSKEDREAFEKGMK